MSANSFSVEQNKEDVTLSYLDISVKIIKIFNSIKRQQFHYYSLKFPRLILFNPRTPTLEQEAGEGGGGGWWNRSPELGTDH